MQSQTRNGPRRQRLRCKWAMWRASLGKRAVWRQAVRIGLVIAAIELLLICAHTWLDDAGGLITSLAILVVVILTAAISGATMDCQREAEGNSWRNN